jgi:hypothetical protein
MEKPVRRLSSFGHKVANVLVGRAGSSGGQSSTQEPAVPTTHIPATEAAAAESAKTLQNQTVRSSILSTSSRSRGSSFVSVLFKKRMSASSGGEQAPAQEEDDDRLDAIAPFNTLDAEEARPLSKSISLLPDASEVENNVNRGSIAPFHFEPDGTPLEYTEEAKS